MSRHAQWFNFGEHSWRKKSNAVNANHNLTKEVEHLNRQWMESYVTRDTAFLEQYLADDYASTFPDGTVLEEKGEIESLKSGDSAHRDDAQRNGRTHLRRGDSGDYRTQHHQGEREGSGSQWRIPLHRCMDHAKRPLAGGCQSGHPDSGIPSVEKNMSLTGQSL